MSGDTLTSAVNLKLEHLELNEGRSQGLDYSSLFPLVQRPSRYIGGGWENVRRDANSRERAVSVCLCFPDLYETGFANTGIEILYRVVNRREDAYAERA